MSPDTHAQKPPPYPSPILLEPLADATDADDDEEEEVVPAAVVECHHDDHHEITCRHGLCTLGFGLKHSHIGALSSRTTCGKFT